MYALESWDGKLYAGGYFTANATDEKTLAHLAVYDPAEDDWATLGGGLNIKYSVPVHALKGRAEGLYIGGDFDYIGGALTANYLAGYNEDGWSEMLACEEGITITAGPSETALTNDGVYAIGNWRASYPTVYYRLACWDGEIWSAIESDYTQFRGIASDGSSMFVGTYSDITGEYHVAEYNGANWQELGGIFNRNPQALAVASDGTVFAAASGSIEIDGETGYNCIAQWYDNQWLKLGSGLTGNSPLANALAIDDDDNLYVGGRFTQAGVVDALNVCLREEDGILSNLGAGLDGTVKVLLVDESTIIAGGDFSGHVAAYINEEWTYLGAGLDGTVRALAVWDDKIYAGGKFETSGETIVNNIAVFSGGNWQALGAGLTPNFSLKG